MQVSQKFDDFHFRERTENTPKNARNATRIGRTKLKILVLTRYGHLGASSRIRFLQYLPLLQEAGFEFLVSPLLDDSQLQTRYFKGGYKFSSLLNAYWRRIRALAHVGRVDLVWIEKEALPWWPAWLERWMLRKAPYVLDYDDAIFHNYDQHPLRFVRFLYRHRIDHLMRSAHTVITGNEYLAQRALGSGAKRVELVPTAIDLDRYSIKSNLESSHHELRIVWIGSPSTVRYLTMLQDSLVELGQKFKFTLRIIGGGKIDLPGVNVEYLQWSEESEASLIRACHIGVMPLQDSPWERGKCGYKLIQYMACGLPVVASPVGINAQIVEQGINGYLAETSKDWIQALTRLMADSELRQRMGKTAREKVERCCTVQVNAPRLASILSASITQS
jgi:glycosyltransferase involved in cell wall biosynthesis